MQSKPTKAQPKTAPAPELKPQPVTAPEAERRSALTGLLTQCLEFELDATTEERELLSQILDEWKRSVHSFPVVAASKALGELKASPGADALDNPDFCELLRLFNIAVSGWGYGGFREKLIDSLLRYSEPDMRFKDALAILMLEFEEMHTDIGCARNALKVYPEELAADIAKAAEELKKRSA